MDTSIISYPHSANAYRQFYKNGIFPSQQKNKTIFFQTKQLDFEKSLTENMQKNNFTLM